jgi:pyruvate dehydrogenase E1 component beta subunit
MHSARVLREGNQVTVIAYGPMVTTAMQAAEIAKEEGVSIEVVDLRSISPIDMATVLDSVRSTNRVVVAAEASIFVSVASELAASITEQAFYHLEAPVIRVGSFDTPYPPAKLEDSYLPDADRILDAVDRVLAY